MNYINHRKHNRKEYEAYLSDIKLFTEVTYNVTTAIVISNYSFKNNHYPNKHKEESKAVIKGDLLLHLAT